MTSAFHDLGRDGLTGLADALRSGRLHPPYHPADVAKLVPSGRAEAIADELRARAAAGMSREHLAWALDLLRHESEQRQGMRDRLELVWTGPKNSVAGVRDTAVVARSLFAAAERSVLASTYVFDGGHKGRDVWRPLAENYDARPTLSVRLFFNVRRAPGDARSDAELLRHAADSLADAWPGQRRPLAYYDPRALNTTGPYRPVLHAKCIIVDDLRAFVTSANFTESAHERNIEAGVLVSDAGFARDLRDQFESLILTRAVLSLPGFAS